MLLFGACSSTAALSPSAQAGNQSDRLRKAARTNHNLSSTQPALPLHPPPRLIMESTTLRRRRLKNCATHHCKKKDWDYGYVPEEGEDDDDFIDWWIPAYGAAWLLGFLFVVSLLVLKVCASIVHARPDLEQEVDDEQGTPSTDYGRFDDNLYEPTRP